MPHFKGAHPDRVYDPAAAKTFARLAKRAVHDLHRALEADYGDAQLQAELARSLDDDNFPPIGQTGSLIHSLRPRHGYVPPIDEAYAQAKADAYSAGNDSLARLLDSFHGAFQDIVKQADRQRVPQYVEHTDDGGTRLASGVFLDTSRFSRADKALYQAIGKCKPPAKFDNAGKAETPAEQAAVAQLLAMYTAGASAKGLDEAKAALLAGGLTIDEKLKAIDAALPVPPTASAKTLGKLLNVTASSVKKTSWWKTHRGGRGNVAIERRREVHKSRAKQIERRPSDDGDYDE